MHRLPLFRTVNSPLARGALIGALTGFGLSLVYGGLILAGLLLMMTLRAPGTPAGDYVIQLIMASATAGFALPCIGVLGVCPGVLWGALLGLLVSVPVSLLSKRMRPLTSTLIGGALAAAVAALWPLLFYFPTATWIETRTYFLWQGVPGLLSIAGGAMIGWWLYHSIQQRIDTPDSLDEALP